MFINLHKKPFDTNDNAKAMREGAISNVKL